MQQGPLPKPFPTLIPRLLLLALLIGLSTTTFSQVFYTIADGTITTCSGPLLDSGGEGAGGYSDNESHTVVICPDASDVGISVNFITFNLSTAGTEPWDHLVVYDGDDTSAPLLGDFNGTTPPGIVSASWSNPSGCLTLVFESNETGTGVFAASITCYEPCQPPTALGTMSENAPALICRNEIVSFDGNASYGAANYGIDRWIWTFDDGTADSTSGPNVSHSFSIPGEYVVELQVEDENECLNTNPMEFQILVSTTPDLEGFANQTLCVGESAVLAPTTVQGVTWTGMPEANFGDGVYLPDELGIPFISSVTFNAFAPGQTLTNINDLLSLCVSMEHSFMGDFVLQITSPNGQSVLLHQQGGGGTFLGVPVDDDTQPTVPGTCWEYCFTPTSTNGTWVDNGTGGTLPSGDYESLQPLTGLLGSPLNGVWTLTFTDLWGSDNGFMCAWSLSLNPALIPDATVYTPVLGINSPDSVFWTGPNLTPDPANHTDATATPTAPGTYQYAFSVVDNFGCTYDTSLTVTATPAASFSVYSDPSVICGQPIQLGVDFNLPMPSGALTYAWTPAGAGLSSLSSPFPQASPTAPTWYFLNVHPVGHPLCGMVDSIHLNALTTLELDTIVDHPLCFGDGNGSIQVTTTGEGGPWDYEWLDPSGNVFRNTTASIGDAAYGLSGGIYEITVREGPNGNDCYDSLLVEILEPELLEMASITADTTICLTGSALLAAMAQGGTAPIQLHWDQGLSAQAAHVVSPPTGNTDYTVYATDANNCISGPIQTTVTVRAPLQYTLPDTLSVCPEVDELLAVQGLSGGDGAYAFNWSNGDNDGPQTVVNSTVSHSFCLELTDGCETPALTQCTWFAVRPMPPLVLSADTLEGCPGVTVRFNLQDTTTTGGIVDWYFDEGFPAQGVGPERWHTFNDPGDFSVSARVLWPNGCYDDTTSVDMIHVEALPDADFTWAPNDPDILWPHVQFIDQSGPHAVRWHWQLLDEDTADTSRFEYTFPGEVGGIYPIKLWAYNYLGCVDSVMRLVEIHDLFEVFVPTGFSPDGDGLNDQLRVQGNDISTVGFEWYIFDRWGERIFATTDLNDGWNGLYNGKEASVGVYPWLIKAFSAYTGLEYELRGFVTLLR